jgi:hypothetical protein
MTLEKKRLPAPSLRLLLHPESDTQYRHFEHAEDVPFEPVASHFSRSNAWWLADASLLSYWDAVAVQQKLRDLAGLQSKFLFAGHMQGFVAWRENFSVVAFRGTEPEDLLDITSDLGVLLSTWDEPGERVHSGFKGALEEIWPALIEVKELKGRPVWFAGHSLGAAVATLAADRFARLRGQHGFGELGGDLHIRIAARRESIIRGWLQFAPSPALFSICQ